MKFRQRVEKYWSVWIFNSAARKPKGGMWEPFEEGFLTWRKAVEALRHVCKRFPDERFGLVVTTNVRLPSPKKRSTAK